MTNWHLITGEFPPEPGGVSDYTQILARALAERGETVHVWAPGDDRHETVEDGFVVHRSCGRFSPRDLKQLGRDLDRCVQPRILLVQYVPHAFGYKAMNIAFTAWLSGRRLCQRDDVRVMFHEVAYPWVRRPWKHNLLAGVNRVMALLAGRACTQAYVSSESWLPLLRAYVSPRLPIHWLPIPSTIPELTDINRVQTVSKHLPQGPIVGHFGTYGDHIRPLLEPIVIALAAEEITVLLLGSGSERFRENMLAARPELATRLIATGARSQEEIAAFLQRCDIMIQPYPDGVSTRRTTVMAALASGRPTVTTRGALTEPFWETAPVRLVPPGSTPAFVGQVRELLDRPEDRQRLGEEAGAFYRHNLGIACTVQRLRPDSSI